MILDGYIFLNYLIKTVITKHENVLIFKSTIYSKPKYKLGQNISFVIQKCKNKWCLVKNDKIHGWIKKSNLWGDF